jgi:hypothetical protein
MSVSNAVGTAAGVVGIGVLGLIGWRVFESARTASALNNAANDLRNTSGQGALDNLLAGLRSSGVLAPGREGALISTGTNQETQIQSASVLNAAELTMLAAQTANGMTKNLRVVRPKDQFSNWKIGEGAWLPSQGVLAGWRTSPVDLVRGLDMNAYALVYLNDVYPPSQDGIGITAYDAKYDSLTPGVGRREFIEWWGRYRELGVRRIATPGGAANSYDIFVTSTDQDGGMVALWDPRRKRFLDSGEAVNVVFAITNSKPSPRQLDQRRTVQGMALHSRFIPSLMSSLERKVRFRPFPPTRFAARIFESS